MFRLMSGIFANSLHGREFCFERLSACKCRSPRKSQPRDYVRKPPAVELGNSSSKSRLWELMKQGCSCPRNTVQERWFSTNQHIILGLAKVLDRPPDAVSNFLYLLTLQNFSKIMNPPAAPGNQCKVPLAYPNACEDYMRLFDTHGNIRSRFDHNCLILLMRVMQAWLRKGAHRNLRPFYPCFGAAHCPIALRSGIKARRAGIDPDSIAHRNGRRRLRESDERACQIRSNLLGYPAKGCPSYLYESRKGDPGYVFGTHFVPQDLNDWDQDYHLGEPSSYEDELAAERARRLEALLFQLNERTFLTRDAYFLIDAIMNIQVEKPRRKSAKQPDTDNSTAKTISDSHYKMLRESEIRSRQKENLLHSFGWNSAQQEHLSHDFKKDSSHKSRRNHHSHRHTVQSVANESVEVSGPTNKLYYGAPIPVLMHEPYSQDKPWTWLNRHPHQTRLNYRGSIVTGKNIRRYRRSTIAGQMEKARERDSVYSIYALDQDQNASATDVPMFGTRPDAKPATRKSHTRHSQVRPSLVPDKNGSNRRLATS